MNWFKEIEENLHQKNRGPSGGAESNKNKKINEQVINEEDEDKEDSKVIFEKKI